MFSQNVVDPREFIMDPAESMWGSQQNSQAWSYSQNSNPPVGQFLTNSQDSSRNNGQMRSLNPSDGSDYWSQSQNVSQNLQENDDDGKYHLRYLNKPPLFKSNGMKSNDGSQQMRTFHHYVEEQKKKSIEQEQRTKLDAITQYLKESSEETRTNIGALKSELATEFENISDKILSNVRESTNHIEKYIENTKQEIESLKNDAFERCNKSSTEVEQLKSAVDGKNKEIELLRKQIADAQQREKDLTEMQSMYLKSSEEILQKILSAVMKQVIKADAVMQTDSQETKENATQCHVIDTSAQQTQTAETDQQEALSNQPEQLQSEYHQQSLASLEKDSQQYPYPALYPQYHVTSNLQRSDGDGSVKETAVDSPTKPSVSQKPAEGPLFEQCLTQQSKSWSHFSSAYRMQPLSHWSPAQRPIMLPNSIPNPSPIAAVAPLKQDIQIKKEDDMLKDDCPYNTKRPKTRRTPLIYKKDDPSSIFMFDLCSESEDSQEHLQQRNDSPEQKLTPKQESEEEKTNAANQTFYIKKNIRQRSITTYGKIRKSSPSDWIRNDKMISPQAALSAWNNKSNLSKPINVANKQQFKAKTRVTSRGSVALMRKEYAENAFAFNDDVDIKNIQFAFRKKAK